MATIQENLGQIWAETGGVTDTGDAKYSTGWVSEIPTFQNFNFVLQALTKNQLSLAESGSWAWQNDINYLPGAVINNAGIVYRCITENGPSTSVQDPAADTTNSYWVYGAVIGNVNPNTLSVEDGLLVKDVNTRTGLTWAGNDITLENETSLISLKTANASTENWLLGNVAGSLVAVEVGTVASPDGRSLALTQPSVHKLYHEGNPPTQSEVAGTIPNNPQDGKLYARQNENWIEASTITVSNEPPPPVAGNGQGWYNLFDGKFYIDINDGDSSQWVPANPPVIPEDDGGFGGINWAGNVKTAPFNALANNGYHVGGVGITVTMPAAPNDGEVIALTDLDGNWDQYNVRVSGNGKQFRSPNSAVSTTDVILDYRGGYIEFVYSLSEDIWLANLAGVGAQGIVVDKFSAGNGPWTLSQAPASKESVLIIIGNVLQDPDAFEINGNQLVISGGASGAIRVWHMGVQLPIGTPGDGTISFSKLDGEMKGRVAAAWVNFDGTGTPTVKDSFNVSSITDQGTGRYGINFTIAIPSINYCAVATTIGSTDAICLESDLIYRSTNTLSVVCSGGASTFDRETVSVVILSNQ